MSKKINTETVNTAGCKVYNFIKHQKMFFIISAVLILFSIGITFTGVDIAIEFKGGTMITYSYAGDINANDAESKIEEIINSNVTIQQGDMFQSEKKKLSISFVSSEGFTAEKQTALTDELKNIYSDNEIELLDSTDVAASSGINFFVKCLVAVGFSAIVLIFYIAIRFKRMSGWSSGVCAVLALLHDVIITYGFFVLIGFQINSNFIAVVLTILGCSINNTIVIYDRIRENKKLMPVATIDDLVNTSISQSLSRSIRTAFTTVSTMIIISITAAVFGVTSILSFSIPITIGMTVGTYSSICLVPTLWVAFQSRKDKKQPKEA